jgi:putative PIN family toxin of toxin-antitoxin system
VRIFFDTNVLFSAFGFQGLCLEVFRESAFRHTAFISSDVLSELERNLRLKLEATEAELKEIREQLLGACVVIDSFAVTEIPVRDPTDIPILSAAIEAHVDILVTGDRDLLDIPRPPIRIITPRALHDELFAR